MARRAMFVGALLLILITVSATAATPVCLQQKDGKSADGDQVIVCQKLFPTPPYVRVAPDAETVFTGVVELDIRQSPGTSNYAITAARFYDRNLTEYALVDAANKPIDEKSPLMQKNHLPSNRVHFIVYTAMGRVLPPATAGGTKRLQLTGLRPAILVEGHAIDERFLGPWEGIVSKMRSPTQWYTDISNTAHVAKVRITFVPPLTPTANIGVLSSEPKLPDGTRFKATGKFDNATQPVRLSTGECAQALNSYGTANPFPPRVATADYALSMWRFPAMHTLNSSDFHIVFDYPKNLYPSATAMAREHNFRLKDYIATTTKPMAMVFGIHGNPVDQLLFSLKPVTGGGGPCK